MDDDEDDKKPIGSRKRKAQQPAEDLRVSKRIKQEEPVQPMELEIKEEEDNQNDDEIPEDEDQGNGTE